ncbi:uncharacterized protein [Palaemon carinicauda]|uniref:uncharacterized protein n=1 Tax=Palaemon carinicauda TaxID=392227 RepID=UPI0035B63D6D
MVGAYTSRDDRVRVIQCFELGLSTAEIVRQTDVKERTVQNIVARYKASGRKEVPLPARKCGRPPLLSERSISLLRREAELNPLFSARQFREKHPEILGKCKVRTLQTYLSVKLGFKSVVAPKKSLLTDAHIKKRKLFFDKFGKWDVNDWKQVLFTDESTFHCSASTSTKVWRSPRYNKYSEKLIRPREKFPKTLMVNKGAREYALS